MVSALDDFVKSEYSALKRSPALESGFKVGDTVRVHQLIKEIAGAKKNISKTAKKALEKMGGGKAQTTERIQVFEGMVIAHKHGLEPGATFTVRKIAGGVAVEKIYPLYSPTIKKIETVSRPKKVRRAKLYFLRTRAGKAARKLGLSAAVKTQTETKGATPDTKSN